MVVPFPKRRAALLLPVQQRRPCDPDSGLWPEPAPKIVAPRSAQGITLGSDFGQVIRRYGWSNDGENSGNYVVMRYGKQDRIAFQSRNNKVLGIVLGRVRPEPPIVGNGLMMGGGGSTLGNP